MGAMNVKTLKEIDQVVETVKSMGQVTFNDISTLTGISTRKIGYLYHNYIKDYPEIGYSLVKGGSGTAGGQIATLRYSNYKKTEVPANDPAPEKPEEKPVTKNGEGYPDPTMAKALSRMENKSGMRYEFCVGEIWRDDSTCGAKYLIMSCFKNSLMCLMLRDMDNFYDPRCDIKINIKDQEYYISPYKILSRPARVMTIKFANTKPDFMSLVKSATAMHLGYRMETTSEPEEKIVEKIVEVPVEKIVEKEVRVEVPVPVEKIVYRDKPAESNELLEYKAAMWDRYIDTVLPV